MNDADPPVAHGLDDHLRRLRARGELSFEEAMRQARGAFPPLVHERLEALGLSEGARANGPAPPARHPVWNPELHPLDAEWYFTDESADSVADAVAAASDDALLIGAPRVAAALLERDVVPTIVDSNRLTARRFAESHRWNFLRHDVSSQVLRLRPRAAVFFDAPWSLEPALTWLTRASNVTVVGGELMFVLYPELLRPRAALEREEILRLASRIGDVTVVPDGVRYESPLFERRAIAASGIHAPTDWRSGDLVRVTARRRIAQHELRPPGDLWETFIIGSQVIKLRQTVPARRAIVAPLHALRDDTLPTVRISETPTAHIDLWTSRNRVASVGDRAAVARWLSRVSGDAVHRSRRDLSSDAELQLRRILEFDADNDERPSCQRRAGP